MCRWTLWHSSCCSYAETHLAGPGGVPEAAQLLPELPARWQPPPPLGEAPPEAPHALGQVSGPHTVIRHHSHCCRFESRQESVALGLPASCILPAPCPLQAVTATSERRLKSRPKLVLCEPCCRHSMVPQRHLQLDSVGTQQSSTPSWVRAAMASRRCSACPVGQCNQCGETPSLKVTI